MIKKSLLAIAVIAIGLSTSSAKAENPFAYNYLFPLTQGQVFRNRLPTPPYFSIYQPVYYGERYKRPYGASPYASWPILDANPSYRPVGRNSVSVIHNHHVGLHSGSKMMESTEVALVEPESHVATIVNPYAKANRIAAK